MNQGAKTGYQAVVARREFDELRGAADRYQPMSDREDRSDLASDSWDMLAVRNAYKSAWRGVLLNKGPFELAIYPMLLDELRPATIIEFGALNGGSAVWLADMCAALGFAPRILTMDIDLSLIHPKALGDERIEFIEGDAFKIEGAFPRETLTALPHPWLIIEDCHANLRGILDHLHNNGMKRGDYLIVEDTNQDAWDAWSAQWMDDTRVARGKTKLTNTRAWVEEHPEYKVDTFYQDFYGYNVGKNWNSMLRNVGADDG